MTVIKKVKTITNRDATFLKTAYKYDVLVDLQNDESFIKSGERFIDYIEGKWCVFKLDKLRIRRYIGAYPNLHSAVFAAKII